MDDKRELILLRLLELMGSDYLFPEEFETVVRNRGLLQQDARPASAILDGDESARLTGDRRGTPNMRPQLMLMKPQIYILPKTDKPANTAIGSTVNKFRFAIVQAIARDPILLDLVGANGNISYLGMETDLKSGALLDGQARLDFSFVYVLDPN